MVHQNRGIAQPVEQRSPKPRAEGSIPSAPANEKSVNTPFADFFVLVSAVKNRVLVTIW